MTLALCYEKVSVPPPPSRHRRRRCGTRFDQPLVRVSRGQDSPAPVNTAPRRHSSASRDAALCHVIVTIRHASVSQYHSNSFDDVPLMLDVDWSSAIAWSRDVDRRSTDVACCSQSSGNNQYTDTLCWTMKPEI